MGLVFECSVFEVLAVSITILLYCVYRFSVKHYDYWKNAGIKHSQPLPFFGNALETVLGKTHGAFVYQKMYNAFQNERYVGMFMLRSPTLLVRDPFLINQVLTKDFAHFYNRGIGFDEKLDPLNANLVNLSGPRWRNLRYKLTPVFSAGKLKTMYDQLDECANELVSFFSESIKESNLLEMRECMAKYSTDVIGSCAFGLQFNALKDPDSEFRTRGREVFTPTFRRLMKLLLATIHPAIPRLFKLTLLSPETERFFFDFVRDTVHQRKTNNVKRNDFIQMLIDIQKENASEASQLVQNKYDDGSPKEAGDKELILDDKLLAANAFVFFVAAFETTSSTMAYCLLELAANQHIQDKIRQEVLDALAENNGSLNYDVIKNMLCMEKVILETLRKYPVATGLLRQCTKNYQFPDSDYTMRKGIRVLIPVYSIQHDSKYYPDPERFDPERFSEENIKKRPEGTYLPFGDGPRICIGLKFAMMEMKIGLCKILPRFELRMSNKMKFPLEFNPRSVLLTPLHGIWLYVYERK